MSLQQGGDAVGSPIMRRNIGFFARYRRSPNISGISGGRADRFISGRLGGQIPRWWGSLPSVHLGRHDATVGDRAGLPCPFVNAAAPPEPRPPWS